MTDSFLGKGMKFPPQIDPLTGLFKTVSEEEAIKDAIYIILKTNKGERKMQPEFGCDLLSYIYEVNDSTIVNLLKLEIVNALNLWEPRIKEIDIEIHTEELVAGKVIIEISYTLRHTSRRDNLVFPYYLQGREEDL
ncbi:GPW/gp25 family protein [Cellulosilyticum ruminicola]|uniref:GPW/gp25 family protein n=1 Tax=Cellulosilyticum ruminicola TaxID=425254 RepID=UPI0006CFBED7|nr:GPW/gp25 family protein [Cellulosilyticum ruminicola]